MLENVQGAGNTVANQIDSLPSESSRSREIIQLQHNQKYTRRHVMTQYHENFREEWV